MAIVARVDVPASEFALGETLETLPEVTARFERVVESGRQVTMPLVWLYGAEEATLERALADDQSVRDASLLATFDDAFLYRIEWTEQVRLTLEMVVNSAATMLDGYCASGTWTLRMLYPDRDALSTTYAFCDDYEQAFDVDFIRRMDGQTPGRFGLTAQQYDALMGAYERGYFEVPRKTDLYDLGEEFGVSHQALSERLRRGHSALIQEALSTSPPPANS